jgi:acyl carrier protein phosphodiesterase
MNFLAHLLLAGPDEDLRLGALLGDFVRGKAALAEFSPAVQKGIMLHRRIDAHMDALPEIVALREWFPPGFRRYGGIIIDLAFDHQLALDWEHHGSQPLAAFDAGVREMLARRDSEVPAGLRRFMAYADRRGLFAAYREKSEILHSLRGIGRRLTRANPLHRVEEIWDPFEARVRVCFAPVFDRIQLDVANWLDSRSTTTGS